jgi:hypothetical protein
MKNTPIHAVLKLPLLVALQHFNYDLDELRLKRLNADAQLSYIYYSVTERYLILCILMI